MSICGCGCKKVVVNEEWITYSVNGKNPRRILGIIKFCAGCGLSVDNEETSNENRKRYEEALKSNTVEPYQKEVIKEGTETDSESTDSTKSDDNSYQYSLFDMDA